MGVMGVSIEAHREEERPLEPVRSRSEVLTYRPENAFFSPRPKATYTPRTPRSESYTPRSESFTPRSDPYTPRSESHIPRRYSFAPRTANPNNHLHTAEPNHPHTTEPNHRRSYYDLLLKTRPATQRASFYPIHPASEPRPTQPPPEVYHSSRSQQPWSTSFSTQQFSPPPSPTPQTSSSHSHSHSHRRSRRSGPGSSSQRRSKHRDAARAKAEQEAMRAPGSYTSERRMSSRKALSPDAEQPLASEQQRLWTTPSPMTTAWLNEAYSLPIDELQDVSASRDTAGSLQWNDSSTSSVWSRCSSTSLMSQSSALSSSIKPCLVLHPQHSRHRIRKSVSFQKGSDGPNGETTRNSHRSRGSMGSVDFAELADPLDTIVSGVQLIDPEDGDVTKMSADSLEGFPGKEVKQAEKGDMASLNAEQMEKVVARGSSALADSKEVGPVVDARALEVDIPAAETAGAAAEAEVLEGTHAKRSLTAVSVVDAASTDVPALEPALPDDSQDDFSGVMPPVVRVTLQPAAALEAFVDGTPVQSGSGPVPAAAAVAAAAAAVVEEKGSDSALAAVLAETLTDEDKVVQQLQATDGAEAAVKLPALAGTVAATAAAEAVSGIQKVAEVAMLPVAATAMGQGVILEGPAAAADDDVKCQRSSEKDVPVADAEVVHEQVAAVATVHVAAAISASSISCHSIAQLVEHEAELEADDEVKICESEDEDETEVVTEVVAAEPHIIAAAPQPAAPQAPTAQSAAPQLPTPQAPAPQAARSVVVPPSPTKAQAAISQTAASQQPEISMVEDGGSSSSDDAATVTSSFTDTSIELTPASTPPTSDVEGPSSSSGSNTDTLVESDATVVVVPTCGTGLMKTPKGSSKANTPWKAIQGDIQGTSVASGRGIKASHSSSPRNIPFRPSMLTSTPSQIISVSESPNWTSAYTADAAAPPATHTCPVHPSQVAQIPKTPRASALRQFFRSGLTSSSPRSPPTCTSPTTTLRPMTFPPPPSVQGTPSHTVNPRLMSERVTDRGASSSASSSFPPTPNSRTVLEMLTPRTMSATARSQEMQSGWALMVWDRHSVVRRVPNFETEARSVSMSQMSTKQRTAPSTPLSARAKLETDFSRKPQVDVASPKGWKVEGVDAAPSKQGFADAGTPSKKGLEVGGGAASPHAVGLYSKPSALPPVGEYGVSNFPLNVGEKGQQMERRQYQGMCGCFRPIDPVRV